LLVSWLAVPRLPRNLVCAALLVLCSCGSLAPQDTSEEAGDAGETSNADTTAATGTTPTGTAADPDAPRPDPADIVVATYNVLRFFDANCDSGQCGSGDYEDAPTQSQFEYRADKLAAAILELDADIVILQEVENQNCIDALSARLGDQYPTAILGEMGQVASVDVAILSRHPSTKVRRHADVPLQRPSGGQTWFSREFLEVHLEVEGHRVITFAAHFKAKSDDDPERRLAEATRAREIIDAVTRNNTDTLVVLGGDLNDTPGSPPLDALEAGDGMLRVAAELAPEDWTYEYKNDRRPIDHIYAATAATGGAYIPGSARVFRSESGEDGYAGSDHAAVRASFRAE
jgi:endonuclease/exonuclease/phosphatase family metal-dependent hydrolase